MQLLSCRNISEEYYLLADVAFKCYDTTWYLWSILFLIPILVVLLAAIPAAMFYGLKKADINK